jgi:predicted methyltransferase
MDNFDNYIDNDLLNMFIENDAQVFRENYKRYWYKLYVFVIKRLRSRESSEEIIQNFH